jgi:hypothetical protein
VRYHVEVGVGGWWQRILGLVVSVTRPSSRHAHLISLPRSTLRLLACCSRFTTVRATTSIS